MLNPRLDDLMTYPFERLSRLLDDVTPPEGIAPIILSIGEPRHAPPSFVAETLSEHADDWGRYPPTRGTPSFRQAIAEWLGRRYDLPEGFITAESHVLPCAGTREALFMFSLVAVPEQKGGPDRGAAANLCPVVLVPNPLYHVYAGAGVMAGAEVIFVPALEKTRFLPDFHAVSPEFLARTALAYLCSPANPQGSAATLDELKALITLAIDHDFILAVDECYSEIYDATPPAGALQAAAAMGAKAEAALNHLVIFNSLSKRSSAPGLRSGFVAGGIAPIAAFAKLRDFASSQTPLPIAMVAEQLWRDEDHVHRIRDDYRAKFDLAKEALAGRYGFYRPDGGVFLWLDVGDGENACRRLWAEAGLKVLPGACLCPDSTEHQRAGSAYIRLALVHETDTLGEALSRLCRVLN
ncbi:MAG: N-succinyldiaminopimelate aminotransferase [Alphaproteobacteria bacterium]|jgi:N-succinyldiaminopimelate aminotransferase